MPKWSPKCLEIFDHKNMVRCNQKHPVATLGNQIYPVATLGKVSVASCMYMYMYRYVNS